jgi:hypothetical protein
MWKPLHSDWNQINDKWAKLKKQPPVSRPRQSQTSPNTTTSATRASFAFLAATVATAKI